MKECTLMSIKKLLSSKESQIDIKESGHNINLDGFKPVS